MLRCGNVWYISSVCCSKKGRSQSVIAQRVILKTVVAQSNEALRSAGFGDSDGDAGHSWALHLHIISPVPTTLFREFSGGDIMSDPRFLTLVCGVNTAGILRELLCNELLLNERALSSYIQIFLPADSPCRNTAMAGGGDDDDDDDDDELMLLYYSGFQCFRFFSDLEL